MAVGYIKVGYFTGPDGDPLEKDSGAGLDAEEMGVGAEWFELEDWGQAVSRIYELAVDEEATVHVSWYKERDA